MRQEEKGSVSIFFIDPQDEKDSIIEELRTKSGFLSAAAIVLPEQAVKAFRSPRDFHEMRQIKRQVDIPIIFVTSGKSTMQWATRSGFPVYASLDAVMEAIQASTGEEHAASPSEFATHEISYSEQNPLFSHSLASHSSLLDNDEDYDPSDSLTALPPYQLFTPDNGTDYSALEDEEAREMSSAYPLPEHGEETNGFIEERPREPEKVPSLPRFSPPPAKPLRRVSLMIILAIVIITSVLSASLFFIQKQQAATTAANRAMSTELAGHVYFLSSGQIGQAGATGINDEVKMTLAGLPNPAAGKKYYAWLESDADISDGKTSLLGSLSISQGSATLLYASPDHANLLLNMSRVLVTEEDAAVPPILPSPDTATWRYEGIIAQQANPNDQAHFSLLNHVRHLLAAEPVLETQGLHGGLTIWLYRNTGKLLEWARDAQDGWGQANQSTHMREQTIRVLDYLDGAKQVANDVPAQTPFLVDPVQGSVGLVPTQPEQQPPSYLQQISSHLSSLITCPGVTATQKQDAVQISTVINNAANWLGKARQDAKAIVALSNTDMQSQKGQTLLNDLVSQLTNAYTGVDDPAKNTELHGIAWLADEVQTLATIDVYAYK